MRIVSAMPTRSTRIKKIKSQTVGAILYSESDVSMTLATLPDSSNFPFIVTLNITKKAVNADFGAFGLTQLGNNPQSTASEAKASSTRLSHRILLFGIMCYF